MKLRTSVNLCITFVVVLGSTCASAEENWPRFRGPNGSGVSDDAVPVQWTQKDFAWKVELPGTGHSSPAVWGKSIFVTSADEEAGKRMLLCLSTSDGKQRWRHEVELKPFKKHGENSYASATPAVDDKHAYVQWTSPEKFTVIAVRHDGNQAWRAELGPYRSNHGGGGSPIVHGDSVIVQVDQDNTGSFIAALDRNTGDVRWRTPRDSTKFSASTPCVYRTKTGGEQLIFVTNANGFTALDPATGQLLWELPGVFEDRVVGSPIVTADLVFGSAGEGGRGKALIAVRRPRRDGDKPEIAYKLTQEVAYVPTPIAYRDWLFTWSDSGTVACHVAATGELLWRDRVRGGFFGSPVCVGGKLYCTTKRGEVVVVNTSGEKLELLARNDLGEPSDATPAVANKRMYLRSLRHLMCIGSENVQQAGSGIAAESADP